MRLIGKKFQFNNLQLLTVLALLMRVCRVDKRRGHGFESRLSEQFLTYIGGIAGTGKTMLVRAFLRDSSTRYDDILGHLDEVERREGKWEKETFDRKLISRQNSILCSDLSN